MNWTDRYMYEPLVPCWNVDEHMEQLIRDFGCCEVEHSPGGHVRLHNPETGIEITMPPAVANWFRDQARSLDG